MAKRRSKAENSCLASILLFMALVSLVQVLPGIFLLFGFGGLLWLIVLWLQSKSDSAVPEGQGSRVTPAHANAIAAFSTECNLIYKKFLRPVRWKVQMERIREAAELRTRIQRAADRAGEAAAEYQKLVTYLDSLIDSAIHSISPEVNRHFQEHLDKVMEAITPSRIAKLAGKQIETLEELASISSRLQPLTQTLILQFKPLLESAEQANTIKSRCAEAKAALKAGDREAALSEYLNLLYMLRTDDIDDEEQGNDIAELEDRVREVVRSYAKLPRRRRTT